MSSLVTVLKQKRKTAVSFYTFVMFVLRMVCNGMFECDGVSVWARTEDLAGAKVTRRLSGRRIDRESMRMLQALLVVAHAQGVMSVHLELDRETAKWEQSELGARDWAREIPTQDSEGSPPDALQHNYMLDPQYRLPLVEWSETIVGDEKYTVFTHRLAFAKYRRKVGDKWVWEKRLVAIKGLNKPKFRKNSARPRGPVKTKVVPNITYGKDQEVGRVDTTGIDMMRTILWGRNTKKDGNKIQDRTKIVGQIIRPQNDDGTWDYESDPVIMGSPFRARPVKEEYTVPIDRQRSWIKVSDKVPYNEARELVESADFTGFQLGDDGILDSTKGRRVLEFPVEPEVLSSDRFEDILREVICPFGDGGDAYIRDLARDLAHILACCKFQNVMRTKHGMAGIKKLVHEHGILHILAGFENYYLLEMGKYEAPDEPGYYSDLHDMYRGTVHEIPEPEGEELDEYGFDRTGEDPNKLVYAYKVLSTLDSTDYVTHSGEYSELFPRKMEVLEFGTVPLTANTLAGLDEIRLEMQRLNNKKTRNAGLFKDPSGEGARWFWIMYKRKAREFVMRAATWKVHGSNRAFMAQLAAGFYTRRDEVMWIPGEPEHFVDEHGTNVLAYEFKPSPRKWPVSYESMCVNLNRARVWLLRHNMTITSLDYTPGDGVGTFYIECEKNEGPPPTTDPRPTKRTGAPPYVGPITLNSDRKRPDETPETPELNQRAREEGLDAQRRGMLEAARAKKAEPRKDDGSLTLHKDTGCDVQIPAGWFRNADGWVYVKPRSK